MVPIINKDNTNIVIDSKSDTSIKNEDKIFFNKDIDNEVKATPKTTINAIVVCAMKELQLQASNKRKNSINNLKFLIDLAMVTNTTKPAPEEPQTFNKAWNHLNKDFHKKW